MSFFGGGGGNQQKKYTVTSADLLNAIVITPFTVNNFAAILNSDNLYNGKVRLQAQQIDNAWTDVDNNSGPSFTALSNVTFGTNNGDWPVGATTNLKIPLTLRAIVDVKATQGQCDVVINYS